MDLADEVGKVDEVNMYDLNGGQYLTISGLAKNGKKFFIRLEVEGVTDGT
jgi:hypothetical protein